MTQRNIKTVQETRKHLLDFEQEYLVHNEDIPCGHKRLIIVPDAVDDLPLTVVELDVRPESIPPVHRVILLLDD